MDLIKGRSPVFLSAALGYTSNSSYILQRHLYLIMKEEKIVLGGEIGSPTDVPVRVQHPFDLSGRISISEVSA